MRAFLKFIIPCLLLAALLSVAKYMDSGKYARGTQKAPEAPTLLAAESVPETTPPTEDVQTVPPETTLPVAVPDAETIPEEVPQEDNALVFTFLGDCTFGSTLTTYYADVGFIKTVGDDYGYPFRNVLSYLESDDLTFLNLEGPLSDIDHPGIGDVLFRGPEAYVNILTQNSVEAVSLANNHIMDHSLVGYNATCAALDGAGVFYAETDKTSLISLDNGVTVGLYATVYTKDNLETLPSRIQSLKQQGADLIIYIPHWGVEGSYHITEEQRLLAHAAIDAGANIVCGSHPHVLQPIEEYKDGIIFYSMANFSFGGSNDPKDMDTALIQQTLLRQEDGSFVLGDRLVVPCSVSSDAVYNNYQPTPYAPGSAEYERVMQKLNGTFTGLSLRND